MMMGGTDTWLRRWVVLGTERRVHRLSFLDTKYVEEVLPVLDTWVRRDGWPAKAGVVEEIKKKKLIVSYRGSISQVFTSGRHPPPP